MALPTSMVRNRDPLKRSGIVVGVFPSTDPLCDLELWRSTQSASTASSLWGVTRYPPSTTPSYTLTFPLPVTTRYQYFKARSQKLGSAASTFTPIVRAKPVILSQFPSNPNVPKNNVGAIELPVPIFMNSNETVEVGAPSQVTPTTYITKRLRINHADLQLDGASTAVKVLYQQGYVENNSGGVTVPNLIGAVVFPIGVTVVQMVLRAYRQAGTTSHIAEATLNRITSTGGVTAVMTLANNTTGWQTRSSSAFSEAVSTSFLYATRARIYSTAAQRSRVQYIEFVYRMPSYDKSI